MSETGDAAQAANGVDNGNGRVPPLKRRGVRLVILAIFAVVAIVGIAWFIHHQTRGRYYESTNDAYLRADFVTVSPRISGYVAEVFVVDNQQVRAGQPLLRIDQRDYEAQAAQSQAQIDVARANADNIRATIREQEATILQARAQLAAAQADAAFNREEAARYAPLAASGAETREKYAQIRNAATRSAADVASARAAVVSAERRVGSLRAQIEQADAQGQGARAQLAAANVNLGSTIIRASVAGRVGDKTVRVGQFVQAGTRTMSIVPLSDIYVIANFKETQIGMMRIGQPVAIEIDALPGIDLHGQIESLSPGTGAEFSLLPPQNATGNFTKIVQRVPVKIRLRAGPETRKLLVPGLSVEAEVDTISAKGAHRAIRDEQEQLQATKG